MQYLLFGPQMTLVVLRATEHDNDDVSLVIGASSYRPPSAKICSLACCGEAGTRARESQSNAHNSQLP
eukprot:2493508-Amphidinium_carterae.1